MTLQISMGCLRTGVDD